MTSRLAIRSGMALIALASLTVACGGDDDESRSETMLPDVDIVALDDGSTMNLADVEGPAVINLWATWCAPCRREIPDFQAVYEERGDEVNFIGINVGEDADQARAFLGEVGATFDQFLDPDGYAVTELQTAAMPVTVVVDANGVISTRHLGPMDQRDLDEAIGRVVD